MKRNGGKKEKGKIRQTLTKAAIDAGFPGFLSDFVSHDLMAASFSVEVAFPLPQIVWTFVSVSVVGGCFSAPRRQSLSALQLHVKVSRLILDSSNENSLKRNKIKRKGQKGMLQDGMNKERSIEKSHVSFSGVGAVIHFLTFPVGRVLLLSHANAPCLSVPFKST